MELASVVYPIGEWTCGESRSDPLTTGKGKLAEAIPGIGETGPEEEAQVGAVRTPYMNLRAMPPVPGRELTRRAGRQHIWFAIDLFAFSQSVFRCLRIVVKPIASAGRGIDQHIVTLIREDSQGGAATAPGYHRAVIAISQHDPDVLGLTCEELSAKPGRPGRFAGTYGELEA